jgi:hypothetical protein
VLGCGVMVTDQWRQGRVQEVIYLNLFVRLAYHGVGTSDFNGHIRGSKFGTDVMMSALG